MSESSVGEGKKGAESSEGGGRVVARGIFRPHTEDTEAQRFLEHGGELALAGRTQRGAMRN